MVGKEGDDQFYRELELAEKEQELPAEIREKLSKGTLRTGYTTGSTASAATKAALYALITGKSVEQVEVTLPKGGTAVLKVARTTRENGTATCAVIKDGGDDPDVTSGAEIRSTVSFNDCVGDINIEGGKGVGRVTKPGLGLEIGKAAINPVPMQMLIKAATEAAGDKLNSKGIDILLTVPRGEEIARKNGQPAARNNWWHINPGNNRDSSAIFNSVVCSCYQAGAGCGSSGRVQGSNPNDRRQKRRLCEGTISFSSRPLLCPDG